MRDVLRRIAPLLEPTLLRAIDALLTSQASAETLLLVRDAMIESADELRFAGHEVHAAQLGSIADYLGGEAERRRDEKPGPHAHTT